jgi:NAD(P)-dependent dehydrogenase (short-subunit alcohol dehydrogenase family)
MEGKTCLVTGSTSGIGKQVALGLARMKAIVVLVGRSREKCEATLQEITRISSSDIGKDQISYLVADLSSQASIRQLAKDFTDAHERLDVLVNNAGIFQARSSVTVDGMEQTFAVNHLAPFLLTSLLADRIKKSRPARIVTTSSIAHKGARIDFDDMQFERRHYSGIRAYGQSKLANILFTKELAKRLQGSGVTSNCFHPGGVRTNLAGGNPWYFRLIWTIISPFLISPEKGADTGIFLASSPSLEGVTGKYFVKRIETRPSNEANDEEAASRLWKVSEQLTNTKFI